MLEHIDCNEGGPNHFTAFLRLILSSWGVFLYASDMHEKREESGGIFLFYSSYLQQPGQDAYDRALYKDMYGLHFGGCACLWVVPWGGICCFGMGRCDIPACLFHRYGRNWDVCMIMRMRVAILFDIWHKQYI